MNKPLVLIQAPVTSRSGYGNHARDITRALIESDKYDIKIWDLRWGGLSRNALEPDLPWHQQIRNKIMDQPVLDRQPDLHIHITVPNEFQPIGKANIGITAGIETTMCSLPWVEGINRMDLTIVPSQHSKKVFDNTVWKKQDQNRQVVQEIRVQKPVEVLFEGIDLDTFWHNKDKKEPKIEELMKSVREPLNFLFVGHWLKGRLGQDRKDVGMLIKTFLETFKNPSGPVPGLILKTGSTFSVMDRNEVMKKISEIKGSVKAKELPNIYLLFGQLTDNEMASLYNHDKVGAHITFTKGEGFGRPLLEASLSGKPVIAPGYSGQSDFLPKDLAVLLAGQLTNVDESASWDNVILKESQWFTVNYNYASQAMKEVLRNYKIFKQRAEQLAQRNANDFNYEKMKEKMFEIIDKHIKITEQKQLDLSGLPKLKKLGETTTDSKPELPKLKKLNDVESAEHGSGQVSKEEKEKIKLPKLKKELNNEVSIKKK